METVNRPFSLREILRIRSSRFAWEQNPQTYEIARGIEDYCVNLPSYKGRPFSEYLAQAIESGGSRILDVGCGKGVFLDEVRRRNPSIKTHGLSAYNYRYPNLLTKIWRLFDSIDYKVGDTHRARRIFDGLHFDLIVSTRAFMYFADQLSAVKQCYTLLKPGGLMFIDALTINPINPQIEDNLKEAWKRRGIKFEPYDDSYHGLVLERGPNPHLPTPLTKV